MSESLTKKLETVKRLLKEPIPEAKAGEVEMSEANPKKAVKKVVKKTAEKAEKKTAGNVVTLAELAKKAKISPARARQKLRAAEGIERDGRWSWEAGSKALAKVEKVLGGE